MIHSVGKRSSKGGVKKAIGYLLRELDHTGTEREAVNIIKGEPDIIEQLERTMTTRHTYVHSSLSFTEKEAATLNKNPEKLDGLIDAYLEQLAAGLPGADAERLATLAVRHDEKNSFHIHFITLRMDIKTGKTYQPFVKQRGDIARFQSWNQVMQNQFGLENPNSAEHQTSAPLSKDLPTDAREIKKQIDAVINNEIEQGRINNRDDITAFINNTSGMSIARETRGSISVKIEGRKQNIRLSGGIYNEHFTSIEKLSAAVAERANTDYEGGKLRLREAMQKLASTSHKYTKENTMDSQHSNPRNSVSVVRAAPAVSMEREQNNGSKVHSSHEPQSGDSGRNNMDKGSKLWQKPRQHDRPAPRREINAPAHKIFNEVEYIENLQMWLWQGGHGFAQIHEIEGGYGLAHGNFMEWQMTAQLLKQNGVKNVNIVVNNEKTLIYALKANLDAGLKVNSVMMNGVQLPIKEIKERLKNHDSNTKFTRDSIADSRDKPERSTDIAVDELTREDANQSTESKRQIDSLNAQLKSIDDVIEDMEAELERQQEAMEENTVELSM